MSRADGDGRQAFDEGVGADAEVRQFPEPHAAADHIEDDLGVGEETESPEGRAPRSQRRTGEA
jgi:hypothetical protein